MMKSLMLLVAISTSACVLDTGDGDPTGGPSDPAPSESYENHVYLECNNSVLVDKTFTSKAACEDFRDSNTFWCSGVKMPVSC